MTDHTSARIETLKAENALMLKAMHKIADGDPTVDSPEADAQLSAAIARATVMAVAEIRADTLLQKNVPVR